MSPDGLPRSARGVSGMDDVRIRSVAPDEIDVAGDLVVDAYRTLGDGGDALIWASDRE
jgi:hypothetical protein